MSLSVKSISDYQVEVTSIRSREVERDILSLFLFPLSNVTHLDCLIDAEIFLNVQLFMYESFIVELTLPLNVNFW